MRGTDIVTRLVVLLTLRGSVALAESRPTVAPFPLKIKRVPSDLPPKQLPVLEAEFARMVRDSNLQVPNSYSLESALQRSKRQDCDLEDSCLSALAVLTSSLYGLFAQVDYGVDGTLTVSGRVVSDDGTLVRPLAVVKKQKVSTKDFMAEAKKAMAQLGTELQLSTLPVARAVTKPPEVVVAAAPDAGVAMSPAPTPDAGVVFTPPPPPPPEPSGLETAGTVTAIAGAATAVGGVLMFAIGRGQAGMVLGPDGLAQPGLTAAQASQARSATILQGAGVAIGAVGVAAAGAGLVMRLLAPEPKRMTTLTVAPMPGGAAVVLTGEFP